MGNIHDPIQSIEEDLLERQNLAEQILYRLSEPDCPPAIGIYGGWGTGKSSLLNLIQVINQHEKEKKIYFEVFDVWRYEATGSLLIPLFVRLNKLLSKKMSSPIKRLIKVTSLFVSDIALRKVSGIGLENIKGYVEEISKDQSPKWEKLVSELEQTTADFKELISQIVKKKNIKKIVICIDNLDRCSPENSIQLLESIKNLFGVPSCTWIIAIDQNAIASYISQKYRDLKINGYDYQ